MSDPTRRKILAMLRKGNMTAGEIADNFDMTKPSISHHLNILKQAELVDAEKKGQQIEYSINTTVLQDILSYVVGLTDKEENE